MTSASSPLEAAAAALGATISYKYRRSIKTQSRSKASKQEGILHLELELWPFEPQIGVGVNGEEEWICKVNLQGILLETIRNEIRPIRPALAHLLAEIDELASI